jgi:hypothetical protein
VEFTSGGTDGPRFDGDGYDLSLGNNVGGYLPSALDARQVAAACHAAGWRVRKSSWTEYEVEHTFAELEIFPETPVRFRGIVNPDRIDELLAAFATLGLLYVIELDGADGADVVIYRSSDTRT